MTDNYDYTKAFINTYRGKAAYYDITRLKQMGADLDSIPYSIRTLLENVLRYAGKVQDASEAVRLLSEWPKSVGSELPFMPYRVLLQDYTGVPLIVDLAAMRSAIARMGRNPRIVNFKVPVDLIIDHSVQVDAWGSANALFRNLEKEYERNAERYSLLKWARSSFDNMRLFPPGEGICHQVNLEYLANVVALQDVGGTLTAFPDTLIGTDSHTTMVNGLGVLGWGVGGIEAEAVMLGEPYYMPVPKVFGVKLTGQLQEGATPTDIVLTVTEALRKEGVVGAFVEYFGDAYTELSVPDRATIGNMSPEYGATVGFSPVDDVTIEYLLDTGRTREHAEFAGSYCVRQGLFLKGGESDAKYSKIIVIDLSRIEPSIAGPRNPDERVPLKAAPSVIRNLIDQFARNNSPSISTQSVERSYQLLNTPSGGTGDDSSKRNQLGDGSIVIAAITSCTNTSNPTVMIGAGLIAKRAVSLNLKPKAYVKASLAPGSTVVTDYLAESNLLPYLTQLGFYIVGYGCTTCIGNSGPLAPEVEKAIREQSLYSVAVLSGNRNFDGRIHPLVRSSFLMSPMLVVAYALAGRIDFDFYREPLGLNHEGKEIFLKDLWPTISEIRQVASTALSPNLYRDRYANPLEGNEKWRSLKSPTGDVYAWDEKSTYIREPPWFVARKSGRGLQDVSGARVLAVFEDKVTTDHISPAGSIPEESPAGAYLQQHGVARTQFSTYGSRRGNHEVMARGGFGNIRLRNLLAMGKEGGWTTHYPSGDLMTIYDAAVRYDKEHVPLMILAGMQYGSGSSRDWAAKAPKLQGVQAIIAESYERIHRSNLIAMGVLPLEFSPGQSRQSLGLRGDETYSVEGITQIAKAQPRLTVKAKSKDKVVAFEVVARLDNEVELNYYRDGGVLPYVFSKLAKYP